GADVGVDATAPVTKIRAVAAVVAEDARDAARRPVAAEGVCHDVVAAAGDAGVVQPVPFDEFAPSRPGEAGVTVRCEVASEQPLRLAGVGGGESVVDVAGTVVGQRAAGQADGLVERLDDGDALQQAPRLECPVLTLEEDVAIEPGDSDAFGGQVGQGG